MIISLLLVGIVIYFSQPYAVSQPNQEVNQEFLIFGMEKGLQGDYLGAIAVFTEIINRHPQAEDAYFNRGIAYAHLQQWEKAIADYNQALAINSQLAEAYVKRSEVYLALDDKEKALSDLENALIRFKNQENHFAYQQVQQQIQRLTERMNH